jgi:hypothetical protein
VTSRIDHATVVARRPSVHAVELDGEAVLLDEDNDRVHLLNATAALVWSGLDGAATVGQLGADLGRHFGVDPEEILSEVVPVLKHFVAEGVAIILR